MATKHRTPPPELWRAPCRLVNYPLRHAGRPGTRWYWLPDDVNEQANRAGLDWHAKLQILDSMIALDGLTLADW